MKEIAELLARMRELESQVFVSGPAPEAAILQLEAAFGRPMPPSYRAFLVTFGGISIVNTSFSGIVDGRIEGSRGCVWTDTLLARETWGLPDQYLVIEPDEDGYKCLDFGRVGRDGECPVVYVMPPRTTPTSMARDYGAWLAENLHAFVEAWEE